MKKKYDKETTKKAKKIEDKKRKKIKATSREKELTKEHDPTVWI